MTSDSLKNGFRRVLRKARRHGETILDTAQTKPTPSITPSVTPSVNPSVTSAPVSSQNAFTFKRLTENDGIRLILLEPKGSRASDDDQHIQCSLVHTTLSQRGNDIFDHYTALSYVWGDPRNIRTIRVNGSPVSVTSNLHAALRDLQDETRTLHLWVDALCIDQSNDEEKSWQVAMMGKIYATAHHTIIYLGSCTESSKALLESLASGATRTTSQDKANSSKSRDDAGMHDLLGRPWFTRIWVFQELVFSRDPWVQCGRLRVRWDSFHDFVDSNPTRSSHYKSQGLVYAKMPDETGIRRTLTDMHRARRTYQSSLISKESPPDLLRVVASRRGSGATDKRDLIFAIIGFVAQGPDSDPRLAVSYEKTCAQVYEDFARFSMEFERWSLFSHIADEPLEERMEGLASWAPDWSRPSTVRPDDHYSVGSAYDYVLEDSYIFIQNPSVLACFGRNLDIIHRQSVELSSTLASLVQARLRACSAHPAKTRIDVFQQHYEAWRYVIGDDILPALPKGWEDSDIMYDILEREIPDLDDAEHEFGLLLAAHLIIRPGWEDPDPLESPTLSTFLRGRRVAVMANGRLGVVPRSAREGDAVVATYLGQDTSLCVLRPFQPQRAEDVDAQIREGFNEINDRLVSDDCDRAFPPRGDGTSIGHYKLVGLCALSCLQESNPDKDGKRPRCFFALH